MGLHTTQITDTKDCVTANRVDVDEQGGNTRSTLLSAHHSNLRSDETQIVPLSYTLTETVT